MVHVFKAISLLSVSIAGVLGQDDSEAPSLAPSAGPNECDAFEAGDFAFVFVNSVDPGDELSLFLFNDVPAGMKLYLTDNAWTGSTFQSDEGSLEFTTPAAGLSQGSNFGYGPNFPDFTWDSVQGSFALDTEGEQVFLYCFGGNGDVVPLAAISYNGDFAEAGKGSYGFGESALPDNLSSAGSIALPHCDEWSYNGPQSASIDELKASIQDTSQWVGKECDNSGSNYIPSVLVNFVVAGSIALYLC